LAELFEESDSEGFIKDYSEFIRENVPTTKGWAEDVAIGLLSTALGYRRYISTRIGRLRLNVWHIFIGPSGIAHKTVPLRYYAIPTLLKLSEITDEDLIFPSSFSMEGMVERMLDQSEGIILRDEVSTLFKEPTAKTYAADILEFMSQLYDGLIQKRYTRKAKLEEVRRCYVVFLGTTTPYLYYVLKPEVFVQGLGNRILYEVWRGKIKKFTGEELFYNIELDEEREEKIARFASALAKLRKARFRLLSPDEEAASLLAEFKAEKDAEANNLYEENPSDLRATYLARAGEMAFKLAGLSAVSRGWLTLPKSKLDEFMISGRDARWAIDKVNRHLKVFDDILKQWMSISKSEPLTVYKLDAYIAEVSRVFDKYGGKVDRSTLLKETRIEAKYLDEVLQYMDVKVEIVKPRGTGRGRPKILYKRVI